MRTIRVILIIYIIMIDFLSGKDVHAQSIQLSHIEHIMGFPSAEPGIEKGVSACFAGTVDNTLLMAGGCNFPDKPAAEGGEKRFYQGIYAAQITDKNELHWQCVGQLPAPCAYGVSIPLEEGLLCIGGNNAMESFATVVEITLNGRQAQLKSYPDLPAKMDNFTGARSGKRVIVSNGAQVFALDLTHLEAGWQVLPPLTTKKLGQPVSAFVEGMFCQWGGCTPKTDTELTALNIAGQSLTHPLKELLPPKNDAGEEIYLGGAAAISLADDAFVAIGGVNKDVFLEAVNHPQPGYMTHPVAWYRFNPYICVYQKGKWHIAGKEQITARAGASLAKHGHDVYLIGGELKPGVRTPDIYRLTFSY